MGRLNPPGPFPRPCSLLDRPSLRTGESGKEFGWGWGPLLGVCKISKFMGGRVGVGTPYLPPPPRLSSQVYRAAPGASTTPGRSGGGGGGEDRAS